MKKYIVALALVLIIPNVSYASVDKQAGVEFLSPLVQTIIQLLQDRIAVLTQEVELLKNRQPVQALCGVPTQTPQEKANELNAKEANRIRAEFASKYIFIDGRIVEETKKINDAKAEIVRLGTGITASQKNTLDKQIEVANVAIVGLEGDKTALKIEERRQLSYVGVY